MLREGDVVCCCERRLSRSLSVCVLQQLVLVVMEPRAAAEAVAVVVKDLVV